jgi:hypothetical protein
MGKFFVHLRGPARTCGSSQLFPFEKNLSI